MNRIASLCQVLLLGGIAALLGACQHLVFERAPEARQVLSEQRPSGCQGDSCPLVNIDTLQFAGEPVLEHLIDERLRRLAVDTPQARLPDSLAEHQAEFLKNAEPGWASYLQAKLRERHGDLLVIELSSYRYTGGAHGQPGRGFINYDHRRDRELRLQDVLVPGQEGRFWRVARQAHQRWLAENGHDGEFAARWPFRQTPHIALLADGVLLKYDVYSIAPYSSGHPELFIAREQLAGILKADYR